MHLDRHKNKQTNEYITRSVFTSSWFLVSQLCCFPLRETYDEVDKQTDRQTDRQTEEQTPNLTYPNLTLKSYLA